MDQICEGGGGLSPALDPPLQRDTTAPMRSHLNHLVVYPQIAIGQRSSSI